MPTKGRTAKNDSEKKAPEALEKKAPKKKPGRPRIKPVRVKRPRKGIVCAPKDASNAVEFWYDKPIVFKKLWNFFKLMAVNKVQIIFRVSEIIIWCEDHHKKSKILTRIDATKVNHYFCTKVLDIGMSSKNIELIMSTIGKSNTNIVFLSKNGYTQKDIRIIHNNDMKIDESHKVELIGEYDKIPNENAYLDMSYTLKFRLPYRYFKKMISDIDKFTDQITIRQDGPNEPLLFEYIKTDKKITSYHIVRDNAIIKFESTLAPDETFRASFKIDHVKPISSEVLAQDIMISAHEDKPLMFSAVMDDNTVSLKILTKIIDHRES